MTKVFLFVSEAATALAMRLAGAVDREEHDLLRLALPAAKYLVCKRAPTVVAEALECLGGDGYVEDSGLPRLYREAPLNSIWEGSGNVTALDVLRAVTREPESAEAVLAEIDAAAGADPGSTGARRSCAPSCASREERRARRLAEMLALCLQGSLLLRYAPDDVASAFVSSRFLPDGPGARRARSPPRPTPRRSWSASPRRRSRGVRPAGRRRGRKPTSRPARRGSRRRRG